MRQHDLIFATLAADRWDASYRDVQAWRRARLVRRATPASGASAPSDSRSTGPVAGGTRRAAVEGFVATLPLWLGMVPFGVVFALAARGTGLSSLETLGMSALIYSGTAQLVATELLGHGAGPAAILLATLVVSLRHLPMAASLASGLGHLPRPTRALLAFQLTDPSYALSVERVRAGRSGAGFLFGSGLSLYLAWQLGTLVGLLLGGRLPDPSALGLDLVVPLSFLALLVPLIRTRAAALAALVGGSLALLGSLLLPGTGWHLLLAIVGGSLAGALAEGPR